MSFFLRIRLLDCEEEDLTLRGKWEDGDFLSWALFGSTLFGSLLSCICICNYLGLGCVQHYSCCSYYRHRFISSYSIDVAVTS
jgi:hypothetical protein